MIKIAVGGDPADFFVPQICGGVLVYFYRTMIGWIRIAGRGKLHFGTALENKAGQNANADESSPTRLHFLLL
jgi:hypothetical protein